MVVQSWADILVGSFQTWWGAFVNFLPNFLGAVIVFLVGLLIAAGLGALVNKLITLSNWINYYPRWVLISFANEPVGS